MNRETAEGAPALREALQKLIDAVSAERANTEHYIMTGRRFRSVKDMSDAVSSALDEAQAALASVHPVPAPAWREAVAWEWFSPDGQHHLTLTEPADYELPLQVTPLYACHIKKEKP